MKALYKFGADVIFTLHILLALFLAFGWTAPSLWYFYMAALLLTLILGVLFGYCLFSKWEFDLRKKADPTISYDFTWATYYTYKLTNQHISYAFFTRIVSTFLI